MTFVVAGLGAIAVLLFYTGLRGGTIHPARRGGRVERLAAEAGMGPRGAPSLLSSSMGAAVVGLVVAAGLTSSAVVGVAFATGGAWLPFARARALRTRRRRRFREAWPDAVATLVAAVRAGVSLPEACSSLSERGPVELRASFAAFASSYRASGSFAAASERLRSKLADPIADRVVVALQLAHEVGGTDLVRVLRTVGDFVREDLRVRKEIEARWSWTITAARVAAAAPWIVLVLMATRPEAAAAYNSQAGMVAVIVGAAATFLGYRLMLRAARLPEERRLGP